MATASTGWSCTHSASIISQTDTTATIRVTSYWTNSGWNYDISHVYSWVYCNGEEYQVKSDGTVSAPSNTGSYSMGYHDFVVSKGTSAKSISCYAKITSNSSYVSGTKSSSASSVSVSAKPSYTVAYNANGGSGAPSNQTKWYGTNLTLSSTKPTRTGYTFSKWNTNTSGTGTSYNPGASYTANAAVTLYAIWTANTYTVTYNANGGSGAPSNQTKTHGVNLTLSSTKPTRTNYNFLGWSTSASGSVVYKAGATYSNNAAVTLYAVWELAYTKPRLNNFAAQRCTSDGTASESGTYVKVTFSWATDKTVSEIKIEYKLQTASSWTGGTITASGTSGSVSRVIGGGNITTESSYHVRAYVSDSGGTTYSSTLSIGTVKFPIDIRKEGKGVAFGKAAETDNLFDVNFASKFRENITADKSIIAKGANLLGGLHSLRQRFTVGGDANTYYPVRLTFNSNYGGKDAFPYVKFSISRSYSWTAPDTWNNSTHRGGLTFSFYWTGDSSWGGNDHSIKVLRFHESYCKMVSGIQTCTTGLIIWLRGGGALYQLESDFGYSLGYTIFESTYTDNNKTAFSPMAYDASKVLSTIKRQMLVPEQITLYNNSTGTNGTVTLSETAANFRYLEIFYRDNVNFYNTIKITEPNNKIGTLISGDGFAYGALYIKMKNVVINGTSIVNLEDGYNHYSETAFTQVITDTHLQNINNIYIVRVDGIR